MSSASYSVDLLQILDIRSPRMSFRRFRESMDYGEGCKEGPVGEDASREGFRPLKMVLKKAVLPDLI